MKKKEASDVFKGTVILCCMIAIICTLLGGLIVYVYSLQHQLSSNYSSNQGGGQPVTDHVSLSVAEVYQWFDRITPIFTNGPVAVDQLVYYQGKDISVDALDESFKLRLIASSVPSLAKTVDRSMYDHASLQYDKRIMEETYLQWYGNLPTYEVGNDSTCSGIYFDSSINAYVQMDDSCRMMDDAVILRPFFDSYEEKDGTLIIRSRVLLATLDGDHYNYYRAYPLTEKIGSLPTSTDLMYDQDFMDELPIYQFVFEKTKAGNYIFTDIDFVE